MEFPKRYDPKEAEPRLQKSWAESGIYAFDKHSRKPVYSIDTPPPTVSGAMHMGHAFSYTQADFIARYKRMTGHMLFYPFGLDDNGLATERFVEKKSNRRAVDMPRDEFIRLCLEQTKEIEQGMVKSWQSLGLSIDWDYQYRTIDEFSRRTSQLSFIELHRQGRAYRREAPTIWCPECKTAIAQVELEDKELQSHFNDIAFKVEKKDLIIATTRPELLSSCVAVIVHPGDVRYQGLIGKTAEVPVFGHHVPIIADSRADPEKGTGAVMCCTFGDQTDMEWWKAYSLPLKISITEDGRINELGGKFKGLKIAEARKKIIEEMGTLGLLKSQKPITHVVNVHERCGKEIEFLVTKQWFIRYLDLKDEFLRMGDKLRWHPEHMKNRYDNWVRGLQWDWCISRQRYFGVPFPVWYCKKCGIEKLAEENELPIDPIAASQSKKCACGSTEFVPEKDVMDTWATSSLTPQIALKWKHDRDLFARNFPMSLRPQAHDIISFWLFNTLVKGYFHSKSVPWHDVMISGWALDSHGKKMSKSKGNVIDPKDMLGKFSADCLRFWSSSSKLGEDLWFSEKEFLTGQRTVNKLWNAARFISSLALEKKHSRPAKLETIDSWMLSNTQKTIKEATKSMDEYDYVHLRILTEKLFWQDLCDNYLEIVKDRLYHPELYKKESVESAKYALYESFLAILKLLSPILPHITDEIYILGYKGHEKSPSIHASKWPEFDEKLLDERAQKAGEFAVAILGAIRRQKSLQNKAMNSPVLALAIECSDEIKEQIEKVVPDISSSMNIEKVEFGKAENPTKLEQQEISIGLKF